MVNISMSEIDLLRKLAGYEVGRYIGNNLILPKIKSDDINVITVPHSIKDVSMLFLDGLNEVLGQYNDILYINANDNINKKVNKYLGWRIYKISELPDIYRGYKGAIKYITDTIQDCDVSTVEEYKLLLDDILKISEIALKEGELFDGLRGC